MVHLGRIICNVSVVVVVVVVRCIWGSVWRHGGGRYEIPRAQMMLPCTGLHINVHIRVHAILEAFTISRISHKCGMVSLGASWSACVASEGMTRHTISS